MANITESATYDVGIYQLETTDPVTGGASGVANSPHKNLANRTAYLKTHVDALEAAGPLLAPLASPGLTGSPTAPTQALGDSSTKIATDEFVQKTLGGLLTKSVAGGSNVTLTAVEAGNGILKFTGALTANIAVIVPVSPTRSWTIQNTTSGAYSLTIKTAAGTGVAIAQGVSDNVYTDGTNVYLSKSASGQTGGVAYFATATAPAGWIKANGAAISRAVYSDLFTIISTQFGVGDGSTTFNIPDLRGEFLRGFDDGRGVDSGRSMSTPQDASEIATYVHADAQIAGATSAIWLPLANSDGVGTPIATVNAPYYMVAASTVNGGATQYAVTSKIRPRNVALLACIKY